MKTNGMPEAAWCAWMNWCSFSLATVAVADVFDSLTSERPYKRAWTRDTHFDPRCIAAFLKDLPRILEIRGIFRD